MILDFDALLSEMPQEEAEAIRADIAQTFRDRAARDAALAPETKRALAELQGKLVEVFATMSPSERTQALFDMEEAVMAQAKDLKVYSEQEAMQMLLSPTEQIEMEKEADEISRQVEAVITHVTPAGGNVFADLGFAPDEAAKLLAETDSGIKTLTESIAKERPGVQARIVANGNKLAAKRDAIKDGSK